MKKFFGIFLALTMCFAFVIPAMAADVEPVVTKTINIAEDLENESDMELVGYFDKWKEITIDVRKHINVDFTTEIGVNSDGEAETFGTQLNTENIFDDTGIPEVPEGEPTPEYKWNPRTGELEPTGVMIPGKAAVPAVPNVRTATLTGSVDDNSGVAGVNQSPGNMNNQANLAAMAYIAAEAQLIEATGFAVQASLFNDIVSVRAQNIDTIDTSINNNSGIVGVNQSAGNINNQLNSAAIAAGLEAVTTGALAEATLKQVSADSLLVHDAVVKTDMITASITGNSGVVSVNQASGDMVNQANVCAVAARLD